MPSRVHDFSEVARIVTYARVYRVYEANFLDGKQRRELTRQFVATCGAMSVAPPEMPRSPEVAPTPRRARGVTGIGDVCSAVEGYKMLGLGGKGPLDSRGWRVGFRHACLVLTES